MGRYEGGRGLKWPKIGDVVYGWPQGQIYLYTYSELTLMNMAIYNRMLELWLVGIAEIEMST